MESRQTCFTSEFYLKGKKRLTKEFLRVILVRLNLTLFQELHLSIFYDTYAKCTSAIYISLFLDNYAFSISHKHSYYNGSKKIFNLET